MKRLACICSLLALGTLHGAEWPAGPAGKHAYLEVVIANQQSQDVDEAGVYFGQRPCTYGVVGARVSKGYLGWRQPVTTNAIVRWTDSSKLKQEQAVSLLGVYDPKVDGALTFTIGATNVTVAFKKIDRR